MIEHPPEAKAVVTEQRADGGALQGLYHIFGGRNAEPAHADGGLKDDAPGQAAVPLVYRPVPGNLARYRHRQRACQTVHHGIIT